MAVDDPTVDPEERATIFAPSATAVEPTTVAAVVAVEGAGR